MLEIVSARDKSFTILNEIFHFPVIIIPSNLKTGQKWQQSAGINTALKKT